MKNLWRSKKSFVWKEDGQHTINICQFLKCDRIWGVLVFLKFSHCLPERVETGSLGATKSKVWIGSFKVKARKTTEHKLHKIWHSLKFCKNSAKRAHPCTGPWSQPYRVLTTPGNMFEHPIISYHSWSILVSRNFGCFSPSRFSHFLCNAMRKTIKAHNNLQTNQQNEHTPGRKLLTSVRTPHKPKWYTVAECASNTYN